MDMNAKHWIIYSRPLNGGKWSCHSLFVQRHVATTAAGALRKFHALLGRHTDMQYRAKLEYPNGSQHYVPPKQETARELFVPSIKS